MGTAVPEFGAVLRDARTLRPLQAAAITERTCCRSPAP
jgi:hypothetical protein